MKIKYVFKIYKKNPQYFKVHFTAMEEEIIYKHIFKH